MPPPISNATAFNNSHNINRKTILMLHPWDKASKDKIDTQDRWLMKASVGKCEVMQVWRKTENFTYALIGSISKLTAHESRKKSHLRRYCALLSGKFCSATQQWSKKAKQNIGTLLETRLGRIGHIITLLNSCIVSISFKEVGSTLVRIGEIKVQNGQNT